MRIIYRQISSFAAAVVFILSVPLIVDFYLINYHYGQITGWGANALLVYEPFLFLNQIGFVFCYYLLILSIYHTPRYQGPINRREKSQRIQWLFFGLALLAIYGFIFARSPFGFTYVGSAVLYIMALPGARFIFFPSKRRNHRLIWRRKVSTDDSINIETRNAGWINIPEPFRHTLIAGGTGSGKSKSVIRPFLKQFIKKGFCGIVFDAKYPDLTDETNTFLCNSKRDIPMFVLDWSDPQRCHRFNVIRANYIKTINYAEEIATSIYNNLDKSSIRNSGEFFTRSSINWFTAVIYFYSRYHPEKCTLPHVLSTILYDDYKGVLSMLISDPVCCDYVSSITTAIEGEAGRQLSGQISSLRNLIAKLNTPQLAWILSGDDFDLDINNPEDPKILCIGMKEQIRKTIAPIVGSILTVAFQQMNAPNKRKSFVLLDEGSMIYLDDLDHLGAISRSNKLALVYVVQDPSMMVEKMGREKSNTVMANMMNNFFGQIASPDFARKVSETIGKEERELIGKGQGQSYSSKMNYNVNQNYRVQEHLVAKPEEIMEFKRGEFIGRTTDELQPFFYGQLKQTKIKKLYKTKPFVKFIRRKDDQELEDIGIIIENNYRKIRSEVKTIISGYANVYAK